jgi:hypothetical protein
MHHPMADTGDAPACFVAVQPIDEVAQGRLVRRLGWTVEVEIVFSSARPLASLAFMWAGCPPTAPMPSIWPTSSGRCGIVAARANSANLIEDEPALRVRIASAMVKPSCVWRAP